MMKKAISMLLCLMLALSCAVSFAETAETENLGVISVNGLFELRGQMPADYQIVPLTEEPEYVAVSIFADDDKPAFVATIALNELFYEAENLRSLDESDLALIEATFEEEYSVEFTYVETASGITWMVAKEIEDGTDYVAYYTIYKGYEIEFVLSQTDANFGTPLTDEQIETATNYISALEIVPVEAAE